MIWVLFGFFVIWIVLNFFLYVFQDDLIFRPSGRKGFESPQLSLPFHELSIPVVLGNLHAVLIKCPHDSPQGLILYFHGNTGDLNRWGGIAADLCRYHYDVLVFDYRGYGQSTGDRSENALYDDSVAVRTYVDDHYDYQKIVYYGRSIGAAMAVDLAAKHTPDQLILETPFAQLSDAVPFLGFVSLYQYLVKYQFKSIDKIGWVKCPVFVLHGTSDRVIPLSSAKRLFEKIALNCKKLIVIDKAGHNNLNSFEIYYTSLEEILNRN
ncbi:alpha/beta hydrolase [Reichenbachiella agarivorans]|uniref:Alpha/beta hydrolase n=1 Tax=Reichenbachiella agarivorans TaxID=2979464 RepID=A0ABY6CNL3_9BACT|nr:alpha/beta hydrolase [Reichenbachiella agarivorans]UXP31349.1 alpha/beta hydrolase [Reichenbachiella agarivorans]